MDFNKWVDDADERLYGFYNSHLDTDYNMHYCSRVKCYMEHVLHDVEAVPTPGWSSRSFEQDLNFILGANNIFAYTCLAVNNTKDRISLLNSLEGCHGRPLAEVYNFNKKKLLNDVFFKACKYQVFHKSGLAINNLLNRPLTKDEAIEHPLWLELASGDKDLLKKYVEVIFDKGKQLGLDKMMEFKIEDTNKIKEVPWQYLGISSIKNGHSAGAYFESIDWWD